MGRWCLWFCILFLFLSLLGECFADQSRGKPTTTMRLSDVDDKEEICRECPPGHFSGTVVEDGKDLNCTEVCAPGSCPARVNCTLCPIGTFSDAYNSSKCEQCDVGYVAKSPGTLNCTECSPGTSSNEENTLCSPCPVGHFNPDPAGSCIPCDIGTHSSSEGATECDDCSEGTYQQFTGQRSCTPCGIGKYNPEVSQRDSSACLICPAGYYCPYVATNEPTPCPINFHCTAGSGLPVACQALFESEATSESCQPKPTLYLLMLAAIIAIVVIIGVVVCVRNNRKKAPGRHYSDVHRLIPEPKDGPVYGGL